MDSPYCGVGDQSLDSCNDHHETSLTVGGGSVDMPTHRTTPQHSPFGMTTDTTTTPDGLTKLRSTILQTIIPNQSTLEDVAELWREFSPFARAGEGTTTGQLGEDVLALIRFLADNMAASSCSFQYSSSMDNPPPTVPTRSTSRLKKRDTDDPLDIIDLVPPAKVDQAVQTDPVACDPPQQRDVVQDLLLAKVEEIANAVQKQQQPQRNLLPVVCPANRSLYHDIPEIDDLIDLMQSELNDTTSCRSGEPSAGSQPIDVLTPERRLQFQLAAAKALHGQALTMDSVAVQIVTDYCARNETTIRCCFDRRRPSHGTLVAAIVGLCKENEDLPEQVAKLVPDVVIRFHALLRRVGSVAPAVTAYAAYMQSTNPSPSTVFHRRIATFFFICQYRQLFIPENFSERAFVDTFTFMQHMAYLRSIRASWITGPDRSGLRFDKFSGFDIQHTCRLAQLVVLRELLIQARVDVHLLDNNAVSDLRLTSGIEPYRRCTSFWLRDCQDHDCLTSSLAYACLMISDRLSLARFVEEHTQMKHMLHQSIVGRVQQQSTAIRGVTIYFQRDDIATYCSLLSEALESAILDTHYEQERLLAQHRRSMQPSKQPTPVARGEEPSPPMSSSASEASSGTAPSWYKNIRTSSSNLSSPTSASAASFSVAHFHPAGNGNTCLAPTTRLRFGLRPVCEHIVRESLREPSSNRVFLAATSLQQKMAPHHIGVINGFDGDNHVSLWDPSPTGSGSAFPDPPIIRLVPPPDPTGSWLFYELRCCFTDDDNDEDSLTPQCTVEGCPGPVKTTTLRPK